MLISLATTDAPVPSEVGGKGASLDSPSSGGVRRAEGGGAHGPVLRAVACRNPRFQRVACRCAGSSNLLHRVAERGAARRTRPLLRTRQGAGGVPALDAERRARIDDVAAGFGTASYAVRSSSPEEDLSGASFAGLYESVLGVDSASLLDAVRVCSGSCLDARVLLYKLKMGFEPLAPAIAVVVQELVASEISGVAFSLNPLTNDFDEIWSTRAGGSAKRW